MVSEQGNFWKEIDIAINRLSVSVANFAIHVGVIRVWRQKFSQQERIMLQT